MQPPGSPQRFILPATVSAVLVGLLVSQILSSANVYFSNLLLHRKIVAIHDAGYLAVPGLDTVPPLTSFAAALWGGLFFTLTAGAALSLLACTAAWFCSRRSRMILALAAVIWIGLLILANADGLTVFAGLFFLLVPPTVFAVGIRGFGRKGRERNRLLQLIPAAPVLLLAIFWLTRMDARLFENIRDHLLLTNPVGTAINDFYYRYTLYPAEVFKPISHKTLRTCHLKGIPEPDLRRQLSAVLRSHDYLAIDDDTLADLVVEKKNGELTLHSGRRQIVTAPSNLFASRAKTLLDEFSRRSDRFQFFRNFTFYGILIGFPILLYLAFYGLLRMIFAVFLSEAKASLLAAGCCLAAGMAAWVPIYQAGKVDITAQNLQAAIRADDWQTRIAALQYIESKALEVQDFPSYQKLIKSPHIQERYWLARSLAAGRGRDSFRKLLFLLNDPHLNVVCQALYALGRRGDPAVIPEVIRTIRASDSWYVQRYGYNTIRKLGWQQPAST